MDIQALTQTQYAGIMALLVLLDFLTGVASAVKRGTFSLSRLSDVFPKNVLTLVLAAAGQIIAAYEGGWVSTVITPAIFAVFAATLGQSILSNTSEIAGTAAKTGATTQTPPTQAPPK